MFHYGHSVARQVFAETPQRMPRGLCVAAMRELAPSIADACIHAPASLSRPYALL